MITDANTFGHSNHRTRLQERLVDGGFDIFAVGIKEPGAEPIFDRQVQIEPALRLDHFARTNCRSCARNGSPDIGVLKICR